MKGITTYQEIGLLLEKAVHYALSILKIPHSHNPYDDRYCEHQGQGLDLEVKGRDVGIECKNVNGRYGMSPYWCKREIDSETRFPSNVIWELKLVVVTFLTVSRRYLEVLKSKGYNFIELGFQVTKSNFKYAVHKLVKKLYWLKKRFNFNSLPMSNVVRESRGCGVSYGVRELVQTKFIHGNQQIQQKIGRDEKVLVGWGIT